MNLLKCRSGLRTLSKLCTSGESKLLLAGVPEVQLQGSFALRGFAQLVSFPLAQTGEGISECELVAWAVKPGDLVGPFDKLCDVQSDKAAIEITSRYGGKVLALHHDVGAMVKVGAPLVDIEVADDVQVAPEHLAAAAAAAAAAPAAAVAPAAAAAAALKLGPNAGGGGGGGGAVGASSDAGMPPPVAAVTANKSVAVAMAAAPAAAATFAAAATRLAPPPPPPVRPGTPPPAEGPCRPQASPAVRAFAKQNGVTLAAVEGSGPGGRITRADVAHYLEQRQRLAAAEAAAEGEEEEGEEEEGQALQASHFLAPAGAVTAGAGAGAPPPQPQQRPGRGRSPEEVLSAYKRLAAAEAGAARGGGGGGEGDSRVVPLRGYRRAMVGAMTAAAALPTFHLHDEVVMDRLLAARDVMRGALESTRPRGAAAAAGTSQAAAAAAGGGGLRLTVLPLIVKALSAALSQHPHMNASLAASGSELLLHPHHNIGVAMATPAGLVVPNIKQVERKSVAAVAAELALLQQLAAAGRLPPEALSGGTITISNIGTIGGTYATPLVSPPEVAIVALGRLQLLPRYSRELTANVMATGATASAAATAAATAAGGMASGGPHPTAGSFLGGGGSGGRWWNEAAAALPRPVPTSIMPVSWGADHRVVDGAALAAFSRSWKEFLEQPERLLLHLA